MAAAIIFHFYHKQFQFQPVCKLNIKKADYTNELNHLIQLICI